MEFSAEEVESFVFCPQAWWVRRRNATGLEAVLEGRRHHILRGDDVRRLVQAEHDAVSSVLHLVSVVLVAVAAVVVAETVLDPVPAAVASLVIAAAAAPYSWKKWRHITRCQKIAVDVRKRWGIEGHAVLSSDLFGSARLGLVGKPDAVTRDEAGGFVVREIKRSKAPDTGVPWPNHVMQVAAYCALVSEAKGTDAVTGVVEYRDRVLPAPYSREVREELYRTLGRMRDAVRSDTSPGRDHDFPNKCGGCQVRNECSERLYAH